jgi:hypothetical protein
VTKWQHAAPLLERALEYAGGTHTVADIWMACEQNRMALWCGHKSVIITEIVEYPRLKACRIFLAAGDMTELLEMETAVADWAKSADCNRMEVIGRKGWKRALKGSGYTEPSTILTKEIGHE